MRGFTVINGINSKNFRNISMKLSKVVENVHFILFVFAVCSHFCIELFKAYCYMKHLPSGTEISSVS